MSLERSGTVFITETFDEDDSWMSSGLFESHWQCGDGRDHRAGPYGVPIERAIDWGREQADVVLVHLDDSGYFSAGVHPPDPSDEEIPAWPDGRTVSRRRAAGMEHLDLVSAEPIAWQVRLPMAVSPKRAEAELGRLRALLAGETAVLDLDVTLERGTIDDGNGLSEIWWPASDAAGDAWMEVTIDDDGPVGLGTEWGIHRANAVFRFFVNACSHAEAAGLVGEIESRAWARAGHPVAALSDGSGVVTMSSHYYYAFDIRPAAGHDERLG